MPLHTIAFTPLPFPAALHPCTRDPAPLPAFPRMHAHTRPAVEAQLAAARCELVAKDEQLRALQQQVAEQRCKQVGPVPGVKSKHWARGAVQCGSVAGSGLTCRLRVDGDCEGKLGCSGG